MNFFKTSALALILATMPAAPALAQQDRTDAAVSATVEEVGPGMEDNTDRPGSDYDKALVNMMGGNNLKLPAYCQRSCENDNRCLAWTYVRPRVQHHNAVCYLKNSVPAATANSCCISGVKRIVGLGKKPTPYVPGPGDTMGETGPVGGGAYKRAEEYDTDRPGSDYSRFLEPRQGACHRSCVNDQRCQAWTWVKPGVQEPQAVCYLKNAMPPPFANTCCTSGVVVR